MVSIKIILSALMGFYLLTFLITFMKSNDDPNQNKRELLNLRPSFQESVYRFSNPSLAYKILKQLDVLDDASRGFRKNKKDEITVLNVEIDEDYCDNHRAYFVEFPESVFEQTNVIMDFSTLSFMRNKVISPIANDIQPKVMILKSAETDLLHDLKLEANVFISRNALFHEMMIGKHYSCLSQASNHIPGKQVLDKKNGIAEALEEYAKKYEDRPQCFNFEKFFPKTWLLYDKESCKEFFKLFNSPEYEKLKQERKIVYIRKVGQGAHMGSGVDPIKDKVETELREMYQNGEKCGKIDDNYLVQNYIHKPLLLNGRKFDFRMYLLMASTNPLMAYYHDGFLRVSLLPYDASSDDKKVLLTNLALNYQIYGEAKEGVLFEGMNEEEIKHSQQWSFERLQNYLLETGRITDRNWLDNYLRPEFKKALIHLLRFSLLSLLEDSTVFQLYGVDFMLDDDLNLWFIEANSKPGLGGYSQEVEKIIVKMLQDQVELVVGLIRSRMKRVVNYVNALIDDGLVQDLGGRGVLIDNLNQKRIVFRKISQNYFEEEFEPSSMNGFSKIIDENYQGVQRYQGLVTQECL